MPHKKNQQINGAQSKAKRGIDNALIKLCVCSYEMRPVLTKKKEKKTSPN